MREMGNTSSSLEVKRETRGGGGGGGGGERGGEGGGITEAEQIRMHNSRLFPRSQSIQA